MINMIEVEVKAHAKDFKIIKIRLRELGAEKIKKEYQKDVYFNAPHKNFAKTDESLRIRKIFQESGLKIVLTYKGAKMDKYSKTRKEIETYIDNDEYAALILENLGFYPVANITKERISYSLDEYIISLDNVNKVGKFVEIEKEAKEGENYENSLNEIFKLFEKIGITEGYERRSYLELLGIYKSY
jgi:adenylate cyclase, class 2